VEPEENELGKAGRLSIDQIFEKLSNTLDACIAVLVEAQEAEYVAENESKPLLNTPTE